MDVRRDLYQNVVLSGGSTCYAGMQDRMESELLWLVLSLKRVRVVAATVDGVLGLVRCPPTPTAPHPPNPTATEHRITLRLVTPV